MVDSSFVSALAYAYAYARARAVTWNVSSSWVGALIFALAWIYDRSFIRDRG